MPSDKDKKIEDAAIEYADKCVSSGHEYHRIMFLAYKSGAHLGYELAQEKITELEQHQKDMEILFRQQQETITALSLREKELEQQLEKANGLLKATSDEWTDGFGEQIADEFMSPAGLAIRQYLTNKGGKGE